MDKFNYQTCCVESDGDSITAMVNAEKVITYQTALKHMTGLLEWARARGYAMRRPSITLRTDWHVSFHKSVYKGDPCYYVQWSGIEYIWLRKPPVDGWGYGALKPE